jgi:hypothetical protein
MQIKNTPDYYRYRQLANHNLKNSIVSAMGIRILHFTLLRIRILPFNLMRIRIRTLPLTFFQVWTLQCPK